MAGSTVLALKQINHQPDQSTAFRTSPTGASRNKRDITWVESTVSWAISHWLTIILVVLLFFCLLPFLAPVAMQVGQPELGRLIYILYTPFCHQLPQRSWFLFGEKFTYTAAEIAQIYPMDDPLTLRFFYGTPEIGWKVAWSDRMISFYTMFPVFGLAYDACRRWWRPLRPIPLPVLALVLAPIAVDGLTHAASDLLYGVSSGGFRDTNFWLATLTGNRWPSFYAGDHFGTFNWWMRLLTGLLAAWGLAFSIFPALDYLIQRESFPTHTRKNQ